MLLLPNLYIVKRKSQFTTIFFKLGFKNCFKFVLILKDFEKSSKL